MTTDRRPLTVAEYDQHLQTDDSGHLYWRGKRLRTTGWTRADRIAFGGAIVAGFIALITLLASWSDIQALFA